MSVTSLSPRSAGESAHGADRLRISEIFLSLQGEADTAGAPTTFVRLTGCPLRCVYCDTAYAFNGGEVKTLDEILAQVAANGVEHVCVTGGEPLAQRSVLTLMGRLCDAGHRVSLETSGAMDIGEVDPRVVRVVDIKTPASGEVHRNVASNLTLLNSNDRVKFVICDRADYEWSRRFIAEHALAERCPVFLSPSHEVLAPRDLADWIVADRLPVRLQVQLHKYLWGDVPGV
ncbi:MAG: 7-carboxy-7-deazaguanine synthase QueE [Pseudomonadota bacterium]